jgi:hypothetical protein
MDVFLSHSSKDAAVAAAACAALERAGLSCWIAPRNIQPGAEWSAAIIEGIESSRLLVLVLTQHSNVSQQVLREVERAVAKGLPIIPLRVEAVQPTKGLEFFISSQHWLDATAPPLERHLAKLTESARALLEVDPAGGPRPPPVISANQPAPPRRRLQTPHVVALVALAAIALLILPAAWLAGQYLTPTKNTNAPPGEPTPQEAKVSESDPHDPLFVRIVTQKFQRWDMSGDGRLAGPEFRHFLANWEGARDDVVVILRRHDVNGDSELSLEELLQFGYVIVRYRDDNGDGRYTLSEFLADDRQAGGKTSGATIVKIFRTTDADGDGFITPLEQERAIAEKLRAD